MGTHPNVILQVNITPNGLTRKTLKGIREAYPESEYCDEDQFKIGGVDYQVVVMASDYYESSQISAKEGDLVFFDLVTYGYGKNIVWGDLEARKAALEEWAKEVCEKFSCSFEVRVGANYW